MISILWNSGSILWCLGEIERAKLQIYLELIVTAHEMSWEKEVMVNDVKTYTLVIKIELKPIIPLCFDEF